MATGDTEVLVLCTTLGIWPAGFFSIDYLLIRNLDGVSSQAYFMMIRATKSITLSFFSKIFELLFILQVNWDYIKKFLG